MALVLMMFLVTVHQSSVTLLMWLNINTQDHFLL